MSPWCQTPGRSPATWRETQHTATRSCVTPGSLQAQSSELIEHISYLRSTNVSSCIYFQSVPWQSHAAGRLCGSCQCGRCSHSWSKYMQRRGKICALQLLCKLCSTFNTDTSWYCAPKVLFILIVSLLRLGGGARRLSRRWLLELAPQVQRFITAARS